MSYVYQRSGTLWVVGFYDPAGKWQPETDQTTAEYAAARCHWLNGGDHPDLTDSLDVLKSALDTISADIRNVQTYGLRIQK